MRRRWRNHGSDMDYVQKIRRKHKQQDEDGCLALTVVVILFTAAAIADFLGII